ncbi:MAG: DUF429 domain-containing protein [Anaerolineae bacterium]
MIHAIGVDLTTSPKRPTAGVVLDEGGCFVAQGLYKEDDEILAFALEHRPALVAVDAPLSLPLGLCCLEETCPCRPLSAGQGRACERELSRLGMGCYYTTKRSIIKGMVYRALRLKDALTREGLAFIEVYPYASKVRLFGRLPPKTTVAGRRILQAQLSCLIPHISPPNQHLLSHDLLDALVAAYTGWLYLQGQTEALGDPREGLLHIPCPPRRKVL